MTRIPSTVSQVTVKKEPDGGDKTEVINGYVGPGV